MSKTSSTPRTLRITPPLTTLPSNPNTPVSCWVERPKASALRGSRGHGIPSRVGLSPPGRESPRSICRTKSPCLPRRLRMPDEEAAAVMRQRTGFEPDMPNIVILRCEFISKLSNKDSWGHLPSRWNAPHRAANRLSRRRWQICCRCLPCPPPRTLTSDEALHPPVFVLLQAPEWPIGMIWMKATR